jgi:5-methylcytosine-specific restriction endonuclease McrA
MLKVRNFERFQHYKDRRPPWIKLYRDLWDDPRFFALTEEERYVLLSLFIVASQNDNHMQNNPAWLARQCATSAKTIERCIPKLMAGEEPWIEESGGVQKSDWASRYISEEIRQLVLARDGNKCRECASLENLEIDHIVPISGGGTGTQDNLQVLCRSCNRKKRGATDARQMLDRCSTDKPKPDSLERERDIQNTEREYIYGEFGHVRLAASQYAKLQAKLNGYLEAYITRLDRWGELEPQKFHKRKSHYLTILTWYDKDLAEGKYGNRQPPESPAERAARLVREMHDGT